MKRLFFSLLAFLIAGSVFAKKDVVTTKLTGTAIINGSILTTNGSRYVATIPATPTYWVESTYGLVKLSYPLPASATSRPTGVATMNVAVSYRVEENGAWVTKTANTTLKLDLQTATATNVAYFRAEGAQTIQATLSSVSIPAGWPSIELETSVTTESFDLLSVNAASGVSLYHDAALTTDGNLKVNWGTIAGAESYELEWTYVSNQGATPAITLGPTDIQVDRFLFRNNSSRVEVKGNTYEIPMIYEKGIIAYRLRAVGKNLVNSIPVLVKSEWTVKDGQCATLGEYPSANLYTYTGLEQKLNWQSSLSFAEEGKHKAVISYHDGSLRNRQAVTRINTDKRAIVGETWYDYNGRPSIQVLPAPVTENKLSFFPNFNLVDGKTQLGKSDYDQSAAGNGCSPLSPALSTNTGASRYYSPSNNFTASTTDNTGSNLLNKNLIPDAEKYPYTQTYYTPDNTGRVAAQSGVGPVYRIGTGKETQYQYSTPQQPELTRLFGTQVGYSQHYKKNVATDPNGQVSVSYLDLDGKVVATALGGNNPATLSPLSGTNGRTIKTSLINYSTNETGPDKISLVYNSKFVVTSPNTIYKFKYTAGIAPFNYYCYDANWNSYLNIFDGVSDLQFLVQDKCGNPLINQNISSVKGSTGVTQPINIDQTLTLQPGEYQISKTLRLNEAKFEEYWAQYLQADGPCIKNQQDFLVEEMANININGCGITCARCNFLVDSIVSASSILTSEDIAHLQTVCDELCSDDNITCRASLEAMRGDMSPGGQYAQLRKEKINQPAAPDVSLDQNNMPKETQIDITLVSASGGFDAGDPSDNQVDPTIYPVSILNDNNRLYFAPFLSTLGVTRPSWHHPVQVNYSGTLPSGYQNWKNQVLFDKNINPVSGFTYAVTDYKDLNGQIFYVNVFKQSDGSFKPAVVSGATPIVVDAETGLYKIPVRHLANVADLEKYWQPHWSNYLLPYHPEFQYYLECIKEEASHAFDYALINTTYQNLLTETDPTKQYLASDGTPQIVGTTQASSKDPFIQSTSNRIYYEFLKKRNDTYQTMAVGTGTAAMRKMAEVVTIMLNCPRTATATCSESNCADGKITNDEEWNTYKAMYLAEKQKVMREKALRKATDGLYYNGCVGHKDYISNPEAEYFRRTVPTTSSVTRTYQDCRKSWQNLIKWDWSCKTVTYTVSYNSTTYPYLNPGQLCYIGRAKDYEKKVQRFYPSYPSGMGGGQPPLRCSTMVTNPANPAEVLQVNVPCQTDLQEASALALEEAQRFKYTSCGLCPVGADVELFLMDLHSKQKLVPGTNLLVSCDLKQHVVKMGEALRREVVPIATPGLDVYWTATLSSDGKTLTGKLINGATTLATLDLRIPAAETAATFNNLSKMCCLTILSSAQVSAFTYEAGKNFSIEATYINGITAKDFKVEGKISKPLSPCTITPRCMLTDDATRTAGFLTVLTTSTTAGKVNDLLTNNTVLSLSQTSNIAFYEFAVKLLLKKDDRDTYGAYVDDITTLSPTWKSYMATTNILSGVVSYTENSVNKQVTIEITGLNSTQAGQVSDFVNLKTEPINMTSTDPCRTAACDKKTFKADAVIISGSQRTYVPVTIYVPTMKPVVCTPAVPPTN